MWSENLMEEILGDDKLFIEKLTDINKSIIAKEIDVSDLVERLGPALTSKNTELRLLATKFLSKLLINLPKDFLNEIQINFITTFYCDRLKDHHSILPNVLIGILAITEMKNLSPGNCTLILNALLANVPFQSQLREDRGNIFQMIKNMTENHADELIEMGANFIYCVINSMNGERDPRNLMFLFKFMPIFLTKFPLHHLADEMFEIFECYFPIDFHPSPNDPASITRDGLAKELSKCLCGSKLFFDKCLELVFEKIDSELVVAKTDSLQLLEEAACNFPAAQFETNFDKIWNILRIEVLPGSTKELVSASLNALIAIINAAKDDKPITENLLHNIFVTISTSLSDINERLFEPSMVIVLACLNNTTNNNAVILIFNTVVPIFLRQIDFEELQFHEKSQLLDLITKMVVLVVNKNVSDKIDDNILAEVQQKYLKYIDINEQNIFDDIQKVSRIFNKENRNQIYTKINNTLLYGDNNYDVTACILEFAKLHPEEIYDSIIKNLISTDLTKTIVENLNKIYNVICSLIVIKYFTKIAIDYITEQIFLRKNVEVLISFEKSLLNITQTDIYKMLYYEYKITDKFIEFVKGRHDLNDDVLSKISSILNIVVSSLELDEQHILLKKYIPILDFKNKNDIYVASGLLGKIAPANICNLDLDKVLNDLTDVALSTDDENVKNVCHMLLCSLVNKVSNKNEIHNNIIIKIVTYLRDEIKKHNKRAIEILSWISKGLLVSGNSTAVDIIGDLTELLDHPTLKTTAALAFEILSVEFPQLHLPMVKLLFKQKLFQIVLNKLLSKIEKWGEQHLIAFSFVLKITPHNVLKMQLKKVGPIIFKCLDVETSKPVEIALDIINKFIQEKDDYIKDHLQYLVAKFIKLAQFKNSMKIRILSLNLLKGITSYPEIDILPYKHDIVYGLMPALDDHKRLVRNAAVEARTIWFLIG